MTSSWGMLLKCVVQVPHHGTCSSSPENSPEPVYKAAAVVCAADTAALGPGAGAEPAAADVFPERVGLLLLLLALR